MFKTYSCKGQFTLQDLYKATLLVELEWEGSCSSQRAHVLLVKGFRFNPLHFQLKAPQLDSDVKDHSLRAATCQTITVENTDLSGTRIPWKSPCYICIKLLNVAAEINC